MTSQDFGDVFVNEIATIMQETNLNETLVYNKTWEYYKGTLMSWLEDPGQDTHRGLNMSSLLLDEAFVVGHTDQEVGVYAVSDDCFRCPFELQMTLSKLLQKPTWVVNTARKFTWRVYTDTREEYMGVRNTTGLLCQMRPDLGEFGVYDFKINATGCELSTSKEPVNVYMPVLLMLGLLTIAWMLYGIGSKIMSFIYKSGTVQYADKEFDVLKQRLRALDTFRGIAIVLMIFVNNGAGGYWWLEHATWNGLTVGDLVFPAFLWIMGVCIPLSVKSAFAKGLTRWRILLKIFKRSFKMFLLGMSLNTVFGTTELLNLRVFGVLQRLAVAYAVSASFYTLTASKYIPTTRGACGQAMKDVISCAWCWVLAAVLLALHTVLTFILHDPNCPIGYLGPGGKHDEWIAPECSGGAAGYIDRVLLGVNHLYTHSDVRRVYGGSVTDPEGLLGCLTSIVQALFGIQAGATVLLQRSHEARVSRWLAWALVFALTGALLAGFSREHGVIPINKNLWSTSFVLVTTACSLVLLSACYVMTDAWRFWAGGPFRAPGLNAIALYIGHSITAAMFPFHCKLPISDTHTIRLAQALWATTLWVIIAHVMAKKKIFITL